MHPTHVTFGQIRPILSSLRDGGLEIGRILRQQDLSGVLDEISDDTQLSLTTYFRIQRAIALTVDDLTAHLSNRKLTYRTGQYVVSQIEKAPTLHAAMISLVEHFNMMHGDAYNSVRIKGETLSVVVDDTTFPYRFRDDEELIHFIGDCLLIKIHCLLDSLSGGVATKALKRVRLERVRDAAPNPQNRFWAVPIDYGRGAYELIYDYELSCRPIHVSGKLDLSSGGLFGHVIKHLETTQSYGEQRSLSVQTLELLSDKPAKQSEIAEAFGISIATLRRRLEEEGSSFRQIMMTAQMTKAETMLSKGVSIMQVSEELGYSDIRAFNRAFKGWKGITPASFVKTSSTTT